MFTNNEKGGMNVCTNADDLDSASTANLNPISELDIVINNVVCSFSVGCHLKLREIALHGSNVEYRRENGMVTMRLRRPYTTASIWSSGRITCTGAISEAQAKVAARRYARILSNLGNPVRFQHFRIVNVLGTCSMPWAIHIVNFSEQYRDSACYEPELHPGVTYKMRDPKATLKIFSTGSITVTAVSVSAIEASIQRLYPMVYEFRKRRQTGNSEDVNSKFKKPNVQPLKIPHLVRRPLPAPIPIPVSIPMSATMPASMSATVSASLSASMSMPMVVPLSKTVTVPLPLFATPQLMVNPGLQREQPSASSSSASENICGNARRRATECWASKLQKKRPRFNDAGSVAIVNAGNLARAASGNNTLRRKPATILTDERIKIQQIEPERLDKQHVDDDEKHW